VIPRVFHQIWLGPSPLPDELAPFVESWRRHHPHWEHHLWTEETLPAGLRREVYERLRAPAERSDVLRLELLARHGGVYVDTDFECLRPLDPLLEGVELFAAELKRGRVNNAILGAAAGHRAILRGLEEIRPLTRFGPVDKRGTGPLFVDRVLQEEGATVLERRLFYPTWQEREGAVAYHHAARSWKDSAGHRKAIWLAHRRLLETRAELAATGGVERLRAGRDDRVELAIRARNKARRTLGPRLELARAELGRRPPRPTRVPKVLHHVRIQPGELPAAVALRLETWRRCHPDWEQRLWREEDLPPDLVRPEAADPLRSPGEREELLRLELVHRHGGVAADLQLLCRRRLDARIAGLDAFAASSPDGAPDAALVGAVPGHPALARALELAEPFEWHGYPSGRTGSAALAHGVDEGLVLLPPRLVAGPGRLAPGAVAARIPPDDSTEQRRRLFAEVLAAERRLRDAQQRLARRREAHGEDYVVPQELDAD
jgi:mannosyltransferase OCH1-like enzyme